MIVFAQLCRASLLACVDDIGQTDIHLVDAYLGMLIWFNSFVQILFVALGTALAASRVVGAAWRSSLVQSLLGGFLFIFLNLLIFCSSSIPSHDVVESIALLVAAMAGGFIGRALLGWLGEIPPFCWAQGSLSQQVGRWRFIVVLVVLTAWTLLLPWAVVGVFVVGLGIRAVRSLRERLLPCERVAT